MGWLNTSGVSTFDVIINVDSEHLVCSLDHALRYRRFEYVARIGADTSLAQRVRTVDFLQSRRWVT